MILCRTGVEARYEDHTELSTFGGTPAVAPCEDDAPVAALAGFLGVDMTDCVMDVLGSGRGLRGCHHLTIRRSQSHPPSSVQRSSHPDLVAWLAGVHLWLTAHVTSEAVSSVSVPIQISTG